jgi:hypothetical protein
MIGQQYTKQQVTEFTKTVTLDCDTRHTIEASQARRPRAFPLTVEGR